MRTAIAVVVLASLGTLAVAGHGKRAKPQYLRAVTAADTAGYAEVTYCVVRPAGECAATIAPPWRPQHAHGKRTITTDTANSDLTADCCYTATWGTLPGKIIDPPCSFTADPCCDGGCDPMPNEEP
jgi:hypothetical protein